jgi:HK97 family phage prohead protease
MRQNLPLTATTLDASRGIFAGYASVFHVVDRQRDRVLPHAFAQHLKQHKAEVKLLWQHAWAEPIGVLLDLFEDARGLFIKGQLLPEVARAREAYALLKTGAINGLSIGYAPKRTRTNPDTGVRDLLEIELFEVSLVTLPANPYATVTLVKNQSFPMPDYAALHAALSDSTRTLRDAISTVRRTNFH